MIFLSSRDAIEDAMHRVTSASNNFVLIEVLQHPREIWDFASRRKEPPGTARCGGPLRGPQIQARPPRRTNWQRSGVEREKRASRTRQLWLTFFQNNSWTHAVVSAEKLHLRERENTRREADARAQLAGALEGVLQPERRQVRDGRGPGRRRRALAGHLAPAPHRHAAKAHFSLREC